LRIISVAWFGVEPQLAFNIIKNMSEKIIKMCEKNEIVYESIIVTNGYNLTRKIDKELSNLKISSGQIILDGPRDIHDKRRPLKSGQKSISLIHKYILVCLMEYQFPSHQIEFLPSFEYNHFLSFEYPYLFVIAILLLFDIFFCMFLYEDNILFDYNLLKLC